MSASLSRLLITALVLAASGLPAMASAARVIAPTPFRDGPAADYAQIGELEQGVRVEVLWCGTREDYCLVDRLGTRGWVPADRLMAVAAANHQADAADDALPSSGGATPKGKGKNAAMEAAPLEPKTTTPVFTEVKPLVFVGN